jgi:uncharacterized membrane protein YczE
MTDFLDSLLIIYLPAALIVGGFVALSLGLVKRKKKFFLGSLIFGVAMLIYAAAFIYIAKN